MTRSSAAWPCPTGSAYLKSAYSLPEPPDEILRDILRGIEEFYLAECPLKPGAQELLGLLSRRGVGISAATAGDERLARAALERLGVLGYFSALLTCEGYGGKDKPIYPERQPRGRDPETRGF